jgi:hypothetical protein
VIRLTEDNIAKAVERCRKLKPVVRFVTDRVFKVESANNGNSYTVTFDVREGEKLAECSCKASERNLVCYHIAGAAAANIYRQGLKRQTA